VSGPPAQGGAACRWGDHRTPATFNSEIRGGSIWALWRNNAKEDFGRPNKFCTHTDQSSRTLVAVVV